MSVQAHPNINAVNLMLEVHKLILSNLRGPSVKAKDDLSMDILNEARLFAIHISTVLDEKAGKESSSEV